MLGRKEKGHEEWQGKDINILRQDKHIHQVIMIIMIHFLAWEHMESDHKMCPFPHLVLDHTLREAH